MILPSDILETIKKYEKEVQYDARERSYGYGDYETVTKSLGRMVSSEKYNELANEIYTQVVEPYLENAELKAKVLAYEAIISNSNFKMAIKKGEK